jgi:hypothetical protein
MITCDETGITREAKAGVDGTAILPPGWKIIGGRTLSPDAIAALYVRRVIMMPVLKPLDISWKEFGAASDDSFREAGK